MILGNTINGEFVYITIPADYVHVYKQILFRMADYGEEMLKDCKATCQDRNKSIIDCFNMFNAAVAAYNTGQVKLANLIIKYITAILNINNDILEDTYSEIELTLSYPNVSCDGGILVPDYHYNQTRTIKYVDGEVITNDVDIPEENIDWQSTVPNFNYNTKVIEVPETDNDTPTDLGVVSIAIDSNGKHAFKEVTIVQGARPVYYVGHIPTAASTFWQIPKEALLTYSRKYPNKEKNVITLKEHNNIAFIMIPDSLNIDEVVWKDEVITRALHYTEEDIINDDGNWWIKDHPTVKINDISYAVYAYRSPEEGTFEVKIK